MGITEEKINWIAEQSYWVEKKRNDVMYHPKEGEEYYYNPDNVELGKFKVISKPVDNTSNGMQAMEVVPINKVTGQVDHRHKYDVIGNVVGNEKKKLFMLYYKAIIG